MVVATSVLEAAKLVAMKWPNSSVSSITEQGMVWYFTQSSIGGGSKIVEIK